MSTPGHVHVLLVPPAVEEAILLERLARDDSIYAKLFERQEAALLQCENPGCCDPREQPHMRAVTATARYTQHDPLNIYFSVYSREHRADCAWGQVHPWSFLFDDGIKGERAVVRGPMIIVKREGGEPGTQGAHCLVPHPGRIVSITEVDHKHILRFCRRHGSARM